MYGELVLEKVLTANLDITKDNSLEFIPKEVELIQAITCHRYSFWFYEAFPVCQNKPISLGKQFLVRLINYGLKFMLHHTKERCF